MRVTRSKRFESAAPPARDAPPDAACGASTSLGVHNTPTDGRPTAHGGGRAALVADGLAVRCELAPEHGGWGLRYSAGEPPLEAGAVIGIYPAHAGMRTSAQHNTLHEPAGAPKGEYALELRRRVLYAACGRRGAGAVNEHAWPNVEFAEVDIDLDDGRGVFDVPLFTVLALVATRRINPGDFIHAHYGAAYAPVRAARGYDVTPLPGPRPRPLELRQHELEEAMCRAFTADELPLLRDVGGVIDFDGEPGARGDPNRYRSRPCSRQAQLEAQLEAQRLRPAPQPASRQPMAQQQTAQQQASPPQSPQQQAAQPQAAQPQAAPQLEAARGASTSAADAEAAAAPLGAAVYELAEPSPTDGDAPAPAPPRPRAGGGPDGRLSLRRAVGDWMRAAGGSAAPTPARAATDTLACPFCSALQDGLTVFARAGCRCGGGPCSRCGIDSCSCPWSGGAPLAPRPTRAAQNPTSWGYIELPLRDPCAPTILIVGGYSGEVAAACRAHFPSHIALTVDFRRAEGSTGLHYCGDARDVLWTRRWRLLVAHPTCRAAARSNTTGRDARVASGELWFGLAFAVLLYCAPADVAVVEQPPSLLEEAYRPADTRLQFLDYGVPYSKEWLLWHRGGDFSAPPPSTPGAASTAHAPHRVIHHDRDERERLRSRTPSAIADVLCRSIDLDARRPQGQPLYHEEVLGLAQGYRQLTGCAPPPGYDDPLARARPRGDQSWQPRSSSVGSDAAATAGGPDALAPAAAGARPDSVGRGASSSALSSAGGEHQRATRR